MSRMRWRLRVALWLGDRLPFELLPRQLNNVLARWMWDTPGFDDYELGAARRPAEEP